MSHPQPCPDHPFPGTCGSLGSLISQLELLLIDAFKGKGYQKISDLLQEKETDSLQKYSNSLLSQLDKALRRILSSLLAVTLQTLFIGKKQLVNFFLPELGRLVTETSVCCALRQEVALSEALCRLTIKKWRDDLVNHWFEDKYLAEAFKEIKDKEFETKIGNDSRGNDTTAMFPQVKKPSDEKLEKFWIDFNTGSHSVTFYIDSTEGVLWDSVRLQKEAVSCYSLKEDGGEKIVKIYMKIPATLNRTEATKIKLCFSAEYEILSVLKKVLGDEKMMANEGEEDSIHTEKQTRQEDRCSAVASQSSDLQKRSNPENYENVDPVSENLFSQHNEQLAVTVVQKKSNSDVTMTAVNQQSELDEVDQGSGRTPMTLRFRTLQVMRRKHLFSESNNEKTSKSESEKSWILNSQKETLPKSLNYTRKKRRVRRKLKGEVPSEEPKDTWQPLDVSMEEHSDVEEEATQEFHKVPAEETKEESFKRKDSDALSGTIVKKPRFFSSETKHLSPESPVKPKKLLDSFEKEDEIVRGLGLYHVPAPNGVSCGQSRYKEMEMSAQNTLKTSEKNVSALLKEIHRCRLNKLETFKKIVVEELASLEKDTQILRDMEKDAVDFWNAQLHKLNSFCNQQKRRIQSVDSALGETAESFASTIVNTTHNLATKSPVENGVFIVPSD
ncbi:hypothetical protein ASZ78_004827 [Callipepla squamata]|uniref:Synaptonemal complex protein 2 Spt16M-like domain-containing protein n=1 Tax=Callipepla squamata TaxID=9009 RepID=A0A226N708_CALSU|nr:hypothetical protein ASZ78_004827 [Callipepla squamata]